MNRISTFNICLLAFGIFTVAVTIILLTCQDPICKRYERWESNLNHYNLLPAQTNIIRYWHQLQIAKQKCGHYENQVAPNFSQAESKSYARLREEAVELRDLLDSMLNREKLFITQNK